MTCNTQHAIRALLHCACSCTQHFTRTLHMQCSIRWMSATQPAIYQPLRVLRSPCCHLHLPARNPLDFFLTFNYTIHVVSVSPRRPLYMPKQKPLATAGWQNTVTCTHMQLGGGGFASKGWCCRNQGDMRSKPKVKRNTLSSTAENTCMVWVIGCGLLTGSVPGT